MKTQTIRYLKQQAQQIDEVIALLKLTHLAERDISENEVMTPEDALNRLKNL